MQIKEFFKKERGVLWNQVQKGFFTAEKKIPICCACLEKLCKNTPISSSCKNSINSIIMICISVCFKLVIKASMAEFGNIDVCRFFRNFYSNNEQSLARSLTDRFYPGRSCGLVLGKTF